MAGLTGLTGLTAQTLGSSKTFNWTWFIELVTCGILVLWFLFYLNRLFATVVSSGIRAYTWHKFRVYLDIKSLQLSFLGGRIFFKGVRYHGENETVYIHNGHITWRYWLRATRQVDLQGPHSNNGRDSERVEKEGGYDSESGSGVPPPPRVSNEPESRIVVSITGLEWFIYNRTPVYDAIVSEAGAKASSSADDEGLPASNAFSKAVGQKFRKRAGPQRKSDNSSFAEKEKFEHRDSLKTATSSDQLPDEPYKDDGGSVTSNDVVPEAEISAFYSMMLRFFPVGVECSRGAISVGNEHTKAIIVSTFDKAWGYIDAAASGPADIFRQMFDFHIDHPVVQMKPNPDYHLPQMAAAERIITGHTAVLRRRPWWKPQFNLASRRRALTHGLRNLLPTFRSSVASFHIHDESKEEDQPYTAFVDANPDSHDWHGLDRYMDEDEGDDHHAWLNIEYARFSTILDCPHLHLNFYWDTPGKVTHDHALSSTSGSGLAVDLNGTNPPAYGMHLDVYGGMVNYGPWSDRLRAEIQNVFFPAAYKTVEAKAPLKPGDIRLSTVMAITVDIKAEITLRVPTRESSKDWRWRGRATAVRDAAAFRKQQQRRHFRFRRSNKRRLGPDVRPFGWIAVAAGAHSKLRYVMDMYPGVEGYHNTLQLSLRHTKASSSVNHSTLWECEEQEVSADLSNPLGWNDLHSWRFDIMNKRMDLFLLRDHASLLLDLISDFTAGQKSDYMTFVPFSYTIGIKFLDLSLFLNANDYNIIDKPCDLNENNFLILSFSRLVGQVSIPLQYFSPAQNSVKFEGNGQEATLVLKTPLWHTLSTFGEDETMATLKTLSLEGSYNYFAATSPALTDSLVMTIIGGYPKFNLQGYLIRYFMNVKDNYFGDTINFSTLEEYQAKLERVRRGEDEKKPPPKKQNDLDVILSVRAEDAAALMPAKIYRRDENLRIDVLLIEADMRFTNYYMDLQVTSSPVEVSIESDVHRDGKLRKDTTGCQLFIDGVSVYGHRLFGAPPTEPTYLCNWDFDVGEIGGECTTEFVRCLVSSITSFIFTMDDDENALPKSGAAAIPDVTFLRARIAGLRIWIVSADTAFLLDIAPAKIALNDWANKHFSQYVKVNVPLLLIAAVESTSAYRQRDALRAQVPTHACVKTALNIAVVNRKMDFARQRALQQAHIRFHDSRTHRADWLLYKPSEHFLDSQRSNWSRQSPSMPVPLMPEPVALTESAGATKDNNSTRETLTATKRRPSSFIAMDSYTQGVSDGPRDQEDDSLGPTTKNTSAATVQAKARRNVHLRSVSGLQSTSSRWTRPHFQLRNIEPDLTYMPITPTADHSYNIDIGAERMGDEGFPSTDDRFKHDGIFCDLVDGIIGFCTPDIVSSVVTLLNEVSPADPETILDDLNMQVVSNIKKLSDKHLGQIDDVALRLPYSQIRIVNQHNAEVHDTGFDQHDLKLDESRITLRVAPQPHTKSLQSSMSMYVSIQSLSIEAAECLPHNKQFNSGAEAKLTDVNLWLVLRGESRARAQVGEVEVVTAGRNLDSLAGLIQRSEQVVSQVIEITKTIGIPERTQHLLYHLTEHRNSGEPSFLSRPVNVLRTAEEHVRLHDSWKMVCRLRHILRQRPAGENRISGCSRLCVEDAEQTRQHILSSFNRWKRWEDAGNDDDALVVAIFGARKPSMASQQVIDTEVEFLLGRAALTIDPGPQQSQVSIQSLDLNFSERPPLNRSRPRSLNQSGKTNKTLQAYCGALGCQLDWELLDLAERLIHLSEPFTRGKQDSQSTVDELKDSTSASDGLTVVIGAEAASLEVRSTNLTLLTGVERFKSSFISSRQENDHHMMSLILSAVSGRLRLRARRSGVLGCKITVPTIYLNAKEDFASSGSRTVLHAAASCEKLRLHVKKDILGLLKIVQMVLTDEMTSVQRLMSILPTKNNDERASAPTQTNPFRIEPHAALFLDDYLLQFDVMPYLRYKLSGTIARTSLVPYNKSRFSLQLDVKENSHSFENPRVRTADPKSVLRMPPMSIFVTIDAGSQQMILGVRAAVERMLLEASAVRACFDAAYRPQTIDYVNEIKSSMSKMQNMPKADAAPQTVETLNRPGMDQNRQLRYTGSLVFEGIQLHCSAPALRPDQDYTVHLDILVATTTMQVSNSTNRSSPLAKKPHFDFILPEVVVQLDRARQQRQNFGRLKTGFRIFGATETEPDGHEVQNFHMSSAGISLDMFAETAILGVDLITFLQARIKSLAAAEGAKKLRSLRRLTLATPETRPFEAEDSSEEDESSSGLLDSTFSVELNAICFRWLLDPTSSFTGYSTEDMVFTVDQIDLKTRREASARLAIKSLQLQLVPRSAPNPFERTANSAFLPEMIFNAAYARSKLTRKFAFKAAGKLVDVRLASNFIIPASAVQRSLAIASAEVRSLDTTSANTGTETSQTQLPKLLGTKRLAHLLVFADFAGAEVTVSPAQEETEERSSAFGFLKGAKRSRAGRYGQAVQSSTGEEATLRAPGIAVQVEFADNGSDDPSLSTEVRVAASSNTLAPSVVPLILEISSSVTNLMEQRNSAAPKPSNTSEDEAKTKPIQVPQQTTDPTAILGRVKLNAGLWVQKQEFSLTCQPIARVSATARFDEIFVVVNTVQPKDQDRFFSIMTTFSNLSASVQHVYSRESTASFAVDSIMISLMNSKHFSNKSGISAILDISPMQAYLNAKQMQDFLLFREIWYPHELRASPSPPRTSLNDESDTGPAILKLQEATSTATLPWHAIVSVREVKLQVDFGQSIGKCDFAVEKLWASSKKNSDSEQNLCIGFDKVGIESLGRMSGFIELQGFRVRTAIRWPMIATSLQAPLVQGSVGFEHLRAKAIFDYQPFAVADVSSFDFLIYNVRQGAASDRLVGILDGGKVQAFCTAAAAAQVLSISQAFERLIQEKQEAFESSLHELDRYLRRKSVVLSSVPRASGIGEIAGQRKAVKTSHAPNLNVDVVITLNAIDAGVFMSSFFDEMTLKMEAVDVSTRFAVGQTGGKTHSGLGMSLGQVHLALSTMTRPNANALGEVSVTDVIERATNARGGTILKVPRLVASMQTWQQASSNTIEYIFRSTFHGKVDVGWNYSRISTIRRMWESHSRALAQKMNKPLAPSAIKITAEPKTGPEGQGQEKITAVVHMPQSKYEYIALEPPIIDTPQLRDLGEATPSLEWIGLHRERLPHVTHSVIIVSLLEVAKEVEDSYTRILGSG